MQVERFFVSRRYRQAAATVEPQLAVDARSRQLTMDRSLGSLPPALQSLTLYEYQGELVDGNRGVIDFADLLKRPLESYKYLLGTVEQGRISLDVASLSWTRSSSARRTRATCGFKEIPEFQSFKGRMELVRVPYLLRLQASSRRSTTRRSRLAHATSGKHIAPHVSWVTALWAVLTRMKKPLGEKYGKNLTEIVGRLGPLEKALLYAENATPEGLSAEQARELVAGIEKIARESDSYPNYEGRTGASPREMKLLIMNAAQSPRYACLSPFAVFDELEDLVRGVTVYEFLKQEPLPGGFHENRKFIFQVRDQLIDKIDDEVRTSMGLVDERRYPTQFERYVSHAPTGSSARGPNPITGRDEDAGRRNDGGDRARPRGVGTPREFRARSSRIGARSIDHPPEARLRGHLPAPSPSCASRSSTSARSRSARSTTTCSIPLTDGPSKMQPTPPPLPRRRWRHEVALRYRDNCAKGRRAGADPKRTSSRAIFSAVQSPARRWSAGRLRPGGREMLVKTWAEELLADVVAQRPSQPGPGDQPNWDCAVLRHDPPITPQPGSSSSPANGCLAGTSRRRSYFAAATAPEL